MVCCAVTMCKNTSTKISKNKDGITFHRFPRDPDRRCLWEIAVNREDEWSASAFSAVCSEHFDIKDFYITEGGLRRLSVDAVPCVNISACQIPKPTFSNLPIDVKPSDSDEVMKLKFKVNRLEIIAENRKRRLHMMWQGRRRLRKKLERMKCIIKHLIRYKEDKLSENK
ncbi:THAP domain-containing protein 2-like [Vanessa tameamea]|uniref:THAP domain-containing protein 2-like n=1 Tax=Vanessa tameamea TaxID=334116 RepID=A0A8B8HR59_VANTA